MKIPFKNSFLSWMMKKRIHQIELFLKYPFAVQDELLLNLIGKAENTEFAKKVLQIKNVHCAPLGEVLLPEKTFNVVTLYDLIEHLSNPFSELKKINKLLQPGGLVVISTPNVKNSIFMKERWTGYIVKGHICFFSKKTLTQMLQRAGFKVIFSKTENKPSGNKQTVSKPPGHPNIAQE